VREARALTQRPYRAVEIHTAAIALTHFLYNYTALYLYTLHTQIARVCTPASLCVDIIIFYLYSIHSIT